MMKYDSPINYYFNNYILRRISDMAESTGMKNLKSRRLYLQVYDEIKSYMKKKNHLLPGDKLPIGDEDVRDAGSQP